MDYKSNIQFRKETLTRLLYSIEENEKRIIEALYKDFKKPEFEAVLTETNYVIGDLKQTIKNIKCWAKPKRVLPSILNFPSSDYIYSEPYGKVLVIAPWNYPFQLALCPLIAAVAAGNSVVLKPSELTPNTSSIIAEIISKVFSKNHVEVIEGGVEVSQNLLAQKWDYIFFTGSVAVGKIVAKAAAEYMTPVTLELGGKNPFIVCDDADIDQAVNWAVLSAFSNAGQRCAAGSRILVFRSIYEKFRKKIITKTNSLKLGIDLDCDLGPVINMRQYENILNAIKNAKKEGGKILSGGRKPTNIKLINGYYIQPTIIENLRRDSYLSTNEIFGPVVTLHVVEDIQDALNFSNSSEYGLTAAIHTRNLDRAVWFAQKIRSGTVNINIGTFGSEPHMPFGGFGLSGNGTREPGVEALDVYSELKNISFLVRENLINT